MANTCLYVFKLEYEELYIKLKVKYWLQFGCTRGIFPLKNMQIHPKANHMYKQSLPKIQPNSKMELIKNLHNIYGLSGVLDVIKPFRVQTFWSMYTFREILFRLLPSYIKQ